MEAERCTFTGVQYIECLVDEGLDTREIVKRSGYSKSYVLRIKRQRQAYNKHQKHDSRGQKPALDDKDLRKIFDLVTSRSSLRMAELVGEPCFLLTLERLTKLLNRDLHKPLSKLQCSRYLKKVGLYHDHPFKLISNNATFKAWQNNEYVSICNNRTTSSEIIFFNSTYVTRNYLYYETDDPVTTEDADVKRKVLLLWAITSKGSWYLYCVHGRYSAGQTVSFLKQLFAEIRRPLILLVNTKHDHIFKHNNIVLEFIKKQRNWDIHELPFPLTS